MTASRLPGNTISISGRIPCSNAAVSDVAPICRHHYTALTWTDGSPLNGEGDPSVNYLRRLWFAARYLLPFAGEHTQRDRKRSIWAFIPLGPVRNADALHLTEVPARLPVGPA